MPPRSTRVLTEARVRQIVAALIRKETRKAFSSNLTDLLSVNTPIVIDNPGTPSAAVGFDLTALTSSTPVVADELMIYDIDLATERKITITNLNVLLDHGVLSGLGDVADHPDYLILDGTRAMTGDLDMNGLDIILDVDGDSKIDHISDDRYNFTSAGNAVIAVEPTSLTLGLIAANRIIVDSGNISFRRPGAGEVRILDAMPLVLDGGILKLNLTGSHNIRENAGATEFFISGPGVVLSLTSTVMTLASIDLDMAGRKIDLDADNDTSISAAVDDTLQFEVGGTDRLTLTATQLAVNGINLNMDSNRLILDSDADTYMEMLVDDVLVIFVGGVLGLVMSSGGTSFTGDLLMATGKVFDLGGFARIDFDTDNDTSMRSTADDNIIIEVGGVDVYTITETDFDFGDVTFSGLDKHHISVNKSVSTTRNNTTVLADDPHLITPTLAGDSAVYIVEGYVLMDAHATPDMKIAFRLPTGASMLIYANGHRADGTTTTRAQHIFTVSGSSAFWEVGTGLQEGFFFTGLIRMSTTAGTFALQWAQNTSSANDTTFLINSHMTLTRVPG